MRLARAQVKRVPHGSLVVSKLGQPTIVKRDIGVATLPVAAVSRVLRVEGPVHALCGHVLWTVMPK